MAIVRHRESVIDQQYIQARLGDIATELYMCSCVYSRLSSLLVNGTIPEPDKQRDLKTGMLYLRLAHVRNQRRLEDLKTNLDDESMEVAAEWLGEDFQDDWVLKGEPAEI